MADQTVNVLSNIALGGSLQFTENNTDWPANPQKSDRSHVVL